LLQHITALGVLSLCLPMVAIGAVIHVPAEQPTIQAGIDAAASGDTVLVADGTYTGTGNKDLGFRGKAIVVRSGSGAGNCIIDCQGQGRGFYFRGGENRDSVLRGFQITNGGEVDFGGGGIRCDDSSPTITDCIIVGNHGDEDGGGILCVNSSALISGNIVADNEAGDPLGFYGDGGGISCFGGFPTIANNLISNNVAITVKLDDMGGGIHCSYSQATLINNVIYGNSAHWGGGISCYGFPVTIVNCTVTGNESQYIGGIDSYDSATITNCIVWGNEGANISGNPIVTYSDVTPLHPGHGNIDADPLFATGPDGDCYLSQIAAGQPADSPCVDTGNPASELIQGTTRTDLVQDWGVVDMGFHYAREMQAFVAISPGPGYDNPPRVSVFPPEQNAEHMFDFQAYGPMHHGANVTCGDVDINEMDEILTGAGPGEMYGPHVRGFRLDGTALPGLSFIAYGTNRWGVNVASGDIDGDAFDEIITGAGPGAVFGPHVRGWDYDGTPGVEPIPGVSYFAYGTPKWGVNVSSGDIDGDGLDEIVTGAGPGAIYGPHVRGWNVDGGPATAMPGVSFLAYGTNRMGVHVTCGDVDEDGIDEIITGTGPGVVFGPHVRGWNYDGSIVSPLPGYSFFAYQTEPLQYGVNVYSGTDMDDDGRDELIVGRGPAPEADTELKVFTYDGSSVREWFSLEAFPGLTHGVNVSAGRF